MDIQSFHTAVIVYCTDIFKITRDTAEEKMDIVWQGCDQESVTGFHPFFIACGIADIPPEKGAEIFLKQQRKIDKIWIM